MLTIRAMSNGEGYASKHLEHNDYYAEDERVVGHWHGRGAEMLGLYGEVKSEDFESLRRACHPETGEFLRQRRSADRKCPDGNTKSRGRHLYDFTISAPKSVSIMATVGGDTRLQKAHEDAVNEALHELEANASARIRQNGAREDRITGNLALAVYHHDASRELDPQLHTHAVAANLTYDGAEGRWKALQASDIYEKRAYLTEVYRNSLARRVRQLGYDIETRHNSKGLDRGFEIHGIPDELLAKYSQRSRQRDKAIENFTAANGRRPTDNEVAVLVRESRADKLIEVSADEVRTRQSKRLSPDESLLLADHYSNSHEQSIALDRPEDSLAYAEEHIFERVSVCRDYEVLTEALRHGRGKISHEQLTAGLMLQESAGTILRNGAEIATRESLNREREMIDSVNRGIGKFDSLGGAYPFIPSDHLNPEQRDAVRTVLESRDRAVNISGAAGTGKTAMLQDLHRGLDESGRKVLAVAPTVNAVEELQKIGFRDAVTVERLLQHSQIQSGMKDAALIVDEAGMISGRQMATLMQLAEANSTRIVFSGDTKQIQSVESCDALRILQKESRLKTVELTQVRRQKEDNYREAIQELRQNPERGFRRLEEIGALREVSYQDRPEATAHAYIDSAHHGRDTLVVCATHEEIDRITEAVRNERKRAGELGEGGWFTRDVSLNWTTAQKSEMRNFRPGQRLGFHRAVKGILKNEILQVKSVENRRLIVQNESGRDRIVTSRQAKSFDVFESRRIEVAPGDRLMFTANFRSRNFRSTNGEIVAVSRVDTKGRIHLQDGRTIPRNYSRFTHGYAVTSHRSQGKSVDSVIISADGMGKEQFYVAASRGRQNITILTSNKQSLHESIALSSARQSASELARKTNPRFTRGFCRGMVGARAMAGFAVRYVSSILRRRTPRPIQIRKPVREPEYDYSISR